MASKKPDCILLSPTGEEYPGYFADAPGDTNFDRTVSYKPSSRGKEAEVQASAAQWAEGGWRWRPVTTDD